MSAIKKFTILICSYNQSESLAKVIGYLSKQQISSPDRVELIIVDNNSHDDTRAVCESLRGTLPFNFKYVFESRQGLSIARNRGVEEAQGDVIIFTDDDARIPEGWVQAYIDIYDRFDADCVYGKILIDWEKGKPYWYHDRYQSMFVGLDYGNRQLLINDQFHEFYGKNFSIRKTLILEFGGFNENLGRKGDRLFIGEETQLYRKLIGGGKVVIYSPDLCLLHMLKEYEYSVAHLRKYYRDATESMYYMANASAKRRIFGRPAHVLRQVFSFCGRFPLQVFRLCIAPSEQARIYLMLEIKRNFHLLGLWLRNDTI